MKGLKVRVEGIRVEVQVAVSNFWGPGSGFRVVQRVKCFGLDCMGSGWRVWGLVHWAILVKSKLCLHSG